MLSTGTGSGYVLVVDAGGKAALPGASPLHGQSILFGLDVQQNRNPHAGGRLCRGILDRQRRTRGRMAPENLARRGSCFYVLDEAKTIPDSIFTSVSRCTLFHAFITSSPGADSGTFYDCFHKNSSLYYKIRVKYEDCPHIEINDPGKAERLKKNTASNPPFIVPQSSGNSPTLTDNPSFPGAPSWSWSTTRPPSWTPGRPAAASTLPPGVMRTSSRPGRATVFHRRPLGRPGHRRSARKVPPQGYRAWHLRRPHLCRRRRTWTPHH